MRTGICCCLPVFCCHKLFYSESCVSTILGLAQMHTEEYQAVRTSFPSSLTNMSWSTDPHCPSPVLKNIVVPPRQQLCQRVSLWASWRECFVGKIQLMCLFWLLAMNVMQTHLGCCWSRACCLLAISLWAGAVWTLEGTRPPLPSFSPAWWGSVGVARCTHIPVSCSLQQPRTIIELLADYFSCFARMFNS